MLITEDHIKLLNRMRVSWDDDEYGAPAIDPKRPYGDSDVERDVAEILEWDIDGDELTEQQERKALAIHKEMEDVLQYLVRTADSSLVGNLAK